MPDETPISIPVPTRGLIKALDREQVPIDGLAEVENWLLRDRDFSTRPGLTQFGDNVSQRPTGLIYYDHGDGSPRAVMATALGWKTFNFTTGTWIALSGTPLTGAFEQQVFRVIQQSGETFLIGVNWKDTPKKWDGNATGYSDIAGAPPIARTMLVLNNRVIMANLRTGVNISPVAVDWSAFNDFDSGWGSQAVLLADTAGEIVIGEEMGNLTGALIKTDSAYRVIAQAGTVPFRFDYVPVPKDEGAAATLGYARIGDGRIVYLARNGNLKVFDLNSVNDFASDHVRVHLQETMNFSTIDRSWMIYDSSNSEILVVYPIKGGSGDADAGIIIKKNGSMYPLRWGGRKLTAGVLARVSEPITIGDLTVPIGSITKTLGEMGLNQLRHDVLVGADNGQVFSMLGETDDGVPIAAYAETGLIPLNGGSNLTTVTSIEHRTNQTLNPQTISVRIGTSKTGELRKLSSPQTVELSQPITKTTGHRVTSKYLSMRLEASATQRIVWKGSFASRARRGSWR